MPLHIPTYLCKYICIIRNAYSFYMPQEVASNTHLDIASPELDHFKTHPRSIDLLVENLITNIHTQIHRWEMNPDPPSR